MKTLDPEVLGVPFISHLVDDVVLRIGDVAYSRHAMVNQLGCGNFAAAGRLARLCKRLGVKSMAQLHKVPPEDLAAVKGIGVTCLYVAMCALDAAGYSVQKWYRWDGSGSVTFGTLKQRAFAKGTRRRHVV